MSQAVWEYAEPGEGGEAVVVRMTEGQILACYWDYWSNNMRRLGLRGINPARCIEDWAIVFWATKVPAALAATETKR